MWINYPLCNLKTCRKQFDGNCTDKRAYEDCPYMNPWIPVTKDTLPDEGKVVIALGKKGTWDFGTYRGYFNDIHYWNWKKNTLKKVYWWMYKDGALPEPYQEKTE